MQYKRRIKFSSQTLLQKSRLKVESKYWKGMAAVIVRVIQQSTACIQSWMLSKTRLSIQSWYRFVNAYLVY